jgi:hypothetical protein
MIPTLVKRTPLVLLGIAAVSLGYRAVAPAIPMPMGIAAIMGADRQERHDAQARPVTAHQESSAPVPAPLRLPAAHDTAAGAEKVAPRDKLAALRAPLSVDSANNPFAASSWLPPAPAAPPPAPTVRADPPTAPPVPFTYMGELDAQTGKPRVFLSNGDRLLIVSPGEVIDGQYRIESVSATNVVLTYLPLNQQQVMSTQNEGK